MAKYLVSLKFQEKETPFLLDISGLLYDLELAHDFGVLLVQPDYRDRKFNRYFWYRNGRRLKSEHRLRVARIAKQSPLEVGLIISVPGALWVLLQIFEKVQNWSLSREKLRLEVEKLRVEQAQRRETILQFYADQLDEIQWNEETEKIETKITDRLSKSAIKLVDAAISSRNGDTSEHDSL